MKGSLEKELEKKVPTLEGVNPSAEKGRLKGSKSCGIMEPVNREGQVKEGRGNLNSKKKGVDARRGKGPWGPEQLKGLKRIHRQRGIRNEMGTKNTS